ncbi:MAG TPA: hypothetical protein VKA09_12160 [Nitrososphaeraceae archaeon]|nr:hypothetical protein [Nitrososphaeraceae archaeon]
MSRYILSGAALASMFIVIGLMTTPYQGLGGTGGSTGRSKYTVMDEGLRVD